MIIYGPTIKEKIQFEKKEDIVFLLKSYSDLCAEEAKQDSALKKHIGSEKKFVKSGN